MDLGGVEPPSDERWNTTELRPCPSTPGERDDDIQLALLEVISPPTRNRRVVSHILLPGGERPGKPLGPLVLSTSGQAAASAGALLRKSTLLTLPVMARSMFQLSASKSGRPEGLLLTVETRQARGRVCYPAGRRGIEPRGRSALEANPLTQSTSLVSRYCDGLGTERAGCTYFFWSTRMTEPPTFAPAVTATSSPASATATGTGFGTAGAMTLA